VPKELFFKVLIPVFVIIFTILWQIDNKSALYSFFMSYFSVIGVVQASFATYKNVVKSRLLNNNTHKLSEGALSDTIDSIEDPFSLYEEDLEVDKKDLKEILKEEKKRLRKSISFKETFKNSLSSFNYKRVSYIFLIGGFIWLKKSGYLDLKVYLMTIPIPILFIIAYLIRNNLAKE